MMLIRADLNFCVPGYPTTKERTFHRSEFLAEGTDLTLCTAGTSARGLKSAITRTSEENGQHQDWRFAGVAPQQQTANRLFSFFFLIHLTPRVSTQPQILRFSFQLEDRRLTRVLKADCHNWAKRVNRLTGLWRALKNSPLGES